MMRQLLSNLRRHVDKDLAATTLNLSWRLVSGPLVLLVLPLCIDKDMQGYWYSFGSLTAIGFLLDLGFSAVILQMAAHEFAFLSLSLGRTALGPASHIANLSSLLRLSCKWGLTTGLAALVVSWIIGALAFSGANDHTSWLLPWSICCLGALITYWNNLLSAFLQGCGELARVQLSYMIGAMVNTAVIVGLLLLGANLFALACASVISSLCQTAMLLVRYSRFLRQLATATGGRAWWSDVSALLWRYGLSWGAGYLHLQTLTPIAFHLQGPAVAGRVGITIALWNAAMGLSRGWITVRMPRVSMMVARGEESSALSTTRRIMLSSTATLMVCIAGLASLVLIMGHFNSQFVTRITSRFLGAWPLTVACAAGFLTLIVDSLAVYLRAHRQEPLLRPSIFAGLMTVCFSLVIMSFCTEDQALTGFGVSTAVSFPMFVCVFFERRRAWVGV